MVFRAKGAFDYSSPHGVHHGGIWQANGDGLSIDINQGYAVLEGRITGQFDLRSMHRGDLAKSRPVIIKNFVP